MIYPLSNVVREPVDERDFIASIPATLNLPESVDLRQWAGAIENQLGTGSCVANSSVSALELLLQKANKFVDLSRLQLYWDVREGYENLRGKDGGAYLSDAFKSASKLGIAPEAAWPFVEAMVNVKPPQSVYDTAQAMKVTKYERVATLGNPLTATQQVLRIKAMLAMGYPVTIAMNVAAEIFGMTGPLDWPTCQYTKGVANPFTDSVGGHAMCVVGYRPIGDKLFFLVENSWGSSYGEQGYFLMAADVLARDGWDAWTCTEFAGVSFAPDWSYQPVTPMTVSIKPNTRTQYLANSGDKTISVDNITADIQGGEGPFVLKWTASDPSVGFVSPYQTTKPTIICGGMAPGATKPITITAEVRDCSLPDQQIATASTQIKICNAIDIDSNYGKAFRLYRAAFGRTPDSGGLAFWCGVLDSGTTLFEVATGFINSAEFVDLYGAAPTNSEYAARLYANVLRRAPDAGGIAWWIDRLNEGASKAEVLIGFSESAENKLGATW
jgi:hypothetical protein